MVSLAEQTGNKKLAEDAAQLTDNSKPGKIGSVARRTYEHYAQSSIQQLAEALKATGLSQKEADFGAHQIIQTAFATGDKAGIQQISLMMDQRFGKTYSEFVRGEYGYKDLQAANKVLRQPEMQKAVVSADAEVMTVDNNEQSGYTQSNVTEIVGGEINASENAELLAGGTISTVSTGQNRIRSHGANTEIIRGELGKLFKNKRHGNKNVAAGEGGWVSKRDFESKTKVGRGLKESFLRTLQRIKSNGFDSIGRRLSKDLQEKVSETIFMDEDGTVFSFFHWTPNEFEEFKYGDGAFHFGTLTAAIDIKSKSETKKDGYFKEVYVISKNPFIIRDEGVFSPDVVCQQLFENQIIDENIWLQISNMDGYLSKSYNTEASRYVRDLLKALGYDSYLYKNKAEASGTWSVGVFDADQIITIAENGVLKENCGVTESDQTQADSDGSASFMPKTSGLDASKESDRKTLKAIGEHFGVKVEFDDLDEIRTNKKTGKKYLFSPEGSYNSDTNTITINTNRKDNHRPLQYILKHELSHSLEVDKEAFTLFAHDVMATQAFTDYYKSKQDPITGEYYKSESEWMQAIIERYQAFGEWLDEDATTVQYKAQCEMVANFVGDCLFGDTESITQQLLAELPTKSRNGFVNFVKAFLAKLKKVFSKSVKLTEIQRLEQRFLETAAVAAESRTAENKKTTSEGGNNAKYSLNIKYTDGTIKKLPDARNLTKEDIVEFLNYAKSGKLKWNTYIPVRKDTPQIIIDTLNQAGESVENLSLVMQVRKAQQAMSNKNKGNKTVKHGNNKRGHSLTAEDIVEITNNLDNPNTIILQTNRYNTNGQPLPNNVVVFVEYNNNGNESVAIIEFESSIDPEFIGTEFGDTDYHTVVTLFEPDAERNGLPFDYVEELLSNPDNFELEIVRRQPIESAIGKKHPNTSKELPSNNKITQNNPVVNNYSMQENKSYSLPPDATMPEILEAVQKGEITVEQAAQMLRPSKTKNPYEIATQPKEAASWTPETGKPKRTGEGDKQSSFYENALGSQIITAEVKSEIENDTFIKNYQGTTNKRTLKMAMEELEEGGRAAR